MPVGSNPTGCSASKERKLEILKICSKHGILILEDDPYYFLTTDIVPSYFELETQVVPGGGQVGSFDLQFSPSRPVFRLQLTLFFLLGRLFFSSIRLLLQDPLFWSSARLRSWAEEGAGRNGRL